MSVNIFDFILNIEYSPLLYNFLFVFFMIILFNYCLVALFHLKLSGFYDINSNGQTDAYSLFHLTLFICRVGFPLCLNFLSYFKKPLNTALEKVNKPLSYYIILNTLFYLIDKWRNRKSSNFREKFSYVLPRSTHYLFLIQSIQYFQQNNEPDWCFHIWL